jgi:mono/diheme cytochrome c family protein
MKRLKITILIASLIVAAFCVIEAYRENLGNEWRDHQIAYKQNLIKLAQTDAEKNTAKGYKIQMKQIVLPEINRIDRCVICHVGMEDPRMANQPNPIKSHPGDFLEKHDVEKVGCTSCHDGQGLAVTYKTSKAHGHEYFWEKPMIDTPFIEANCYRCHQDDLDETPHYNKGKELFNKSGCLGCHKVEGKGGSLGPELTNIGNASFYLRSPAVRKGRDKLLHHFNHNPNLAFLYESIKNPQAQPEDSLMINPKYSEDEAEHVTVFLKGLQSSSFKKFIPDYRPSKASSIERGKEVYGAFCSACHAPSGEGKHIVEYNKYGPAISGQAFLSIVDDPEIKHMISNARADVMPAFPESTGVKEGELDDLINYLRSQLKKAPSFKAVNSKMGNFRQGQNLFKANCLTCHQKTTPGAAYTIAPDLRHSKVVNTGSKRTIYDSLVKRKKGTAMPVWNNLSSQQLANLITYLKSSTSGKYARLSKKSTAKANIAKGKDLFEENCNICHGKSDKSDIAPQLFRKEFLDNTSDGFLEANMILGRKGTKMKSVVKGGGGTIELSLTEVRDVIGYLRDEVSK